MCGCECLGGCDDRKIGLKLNVLKMGIVKLVVFWSGREKREERRGEPGEMARSRSDHPSPGRLCYDCSFLFPLFTWILCT